MICCIIYTEKWDAESRRNADDSVFWHEIYKLYMVVSFTGSCILNYYV